MGNIIFGYVPIVPTPRVTILGSKFIHGTHNQSNNSKNVSPNIPQRFTKKQFTRKGVRSSGKI